MNGSVGQKKLTSALDASLSVLQEIYADLDGRTAAFSQSRDIRCPLGCGSCCSSFEPDITYAEGKYVAHYLLTTSPSLIDRLSTRATDKGCVFYEPDGIYHCTIYAVRPLVCRAFGFSASAGKDGQPRFAGCKRMPGAKTTASPLGESEYASPVMSEYGIRVSALSTGARTAMRSEVLRALSSMYLSIRLSSPSCDQP